MPNDPKKFDPARAHVLDAPEREEYLPTAALVEALAAPRGARVVDYGAGTGRIARALADALGGGEVAAVEENAEMFEHLAGAPHARVQPMLIAQNTVPLPDGWADRVLALNLLHEIRGETALAEMARLLTAPDGVLLVVDWERGRERTFGPPDEILYSASEARLELEDAGLVVEPAPLVLPFHFALAARHPGADETTSTTRS